MFQHSETLEFSIGEINKDRLKGWIFNDDIIHNFTEEMDTATLLKEKYAELCDIETDGYYINIANSGKLFTYNYLHSIFI